MPNTLSRAEVYNLIDGERAYQDRRWGSDLARNGIHEHSPQEWLTYIVDYANEALHTGARTEDQFAHPLQMAIIRKIGGMAVAAMEQEGCPPREALQPKA